MKICKNIKSFISMDKTLIKQTLLVDGVSIVVTLIIALFAIGFEMELFIIVGINLAVILITIFTWDKRIVYCISQNIRSFIILLLDIFITGYAYELYSNSGGKSIILAVFIISLFSPTL